jgi:chromosome partitioning protein
MAMILVAGGTKGGSGKTTIATTLAIMRAAEGHAVLLIDADDQETASDFTVLRNERLPGGAGYTSIQLTGSAVRTETQRLAGKYQATSEHCLPLCGMKPTLPRRHQLDQHPWPHGT